MVNIFKKISRGANNVFKKIDKGANNFFKKLPSELNKVGGDIRDGLNKGLDETGKFARKVGNSLEKYAAPAISGLAMAGSALMPQFAPAIMAGSAALQKGVTGATAMSRAIQQGSKAGQGTVNALQNTLNNKVAQHLPSVQNALNKGLSEAQSRTTGALDGLSKIKIH